MSEKVHIVGLGKSGSAAALLAMRMGFDVTATDAKSAGEIPDCGKLRAAGIVLDLEGHDARLFREADLVIVSPGIGRLKEIEEAEKAGVPVISEIEFAGRFFKSRTVAVTGTNGKSTVVTMIASILDQTGMPMWVGGNIGTALSTAVDSDANAPGGWIVLELSSFQLERVVEFHPRIAVILNITPDHFDRYDSFDDYGEAKCNIFKNQTGDDHLLLPAGSDVLRRLSGASRSMLHFVGEESGEIFYEGGLIRIRGAGGLEADVDPRQCNLTNTLAVNNAMFAVTASLLAGATLEHVREGLRAFKPLRHRFQLVAEARGVRWINDSKATNPESAVKAMEAAGNNIILLAGGLGKGLDFAPMAGGVRGRVKAALLFGESAGEIREVIEGIVPVENLSSLSEAVTRAARLAAAGDTVLLAPGCASFDMFRNFEDRGEQFIALVMETAKHGRV